MHKLSRDSWMGYRRKAQNYFWPWTLLVISVGIIFFQLGKVSRTNQQFRRVPNQSMMASPIFPVPGYRPHPQGRPSKMRMKAQPVAKKAHRSAKKMKAASRKRYKQRARSGVARAGSVGTGPKIVHE